MQAHDTEAAPRRVLFLVEFTRNGPRVSHCKPTEALADLAQSEMVDRTPANLPEVAFASLQDWWNEYLFGQWARGSAR